MARGEPIPPSAPGNIKGRIGAVEDVEAGELVKSNNAVKSPGRGRREFSGKGPVHSVVGESADRQQRERKVVGKIAEIFAGKDHDLMAATAQQPRHVEAMALQAAFGKEP